MATSVESQVRKVLEDRKKRGVSIKPSEPTQTIRFKTNKSSSSKSSSSKKKSSGGSSKTPLQMGIVEASTGKVIQEAGPKKSSGGSSKTPTSSVSTKGFTTTSQMFDTKKGTVVKTVRDSSGKVIGGSSRAMTLQEKLQVKPQLTEAQKLQRAGFELKPMQFGQSGQFGTITPEQLRQQQQTPIKTFSPVVVTEAEKRKFKGEDTFQFNTGQEIVLGRGGKARSLTPKEAKELAIERNPQLVQEIKVNPLRVFTGSANAGFDTGTLVANPGLVLVALNEMKKDLPGVITQTSKDIQKQATRDPFSLIGEFLAFSRGTQKVIKPKFKDLKKENIKKDIDRINQEIKELQQKGVNLRQRTPEASKLRDLNTQKSILEDTTKVYDKLDKKIKDLDVKTREFKDKPSKQKANDIKKKGQKLVTETKKELNQLSKKIEKSKLLEQKTKLPKIKIIKQLPKDKTKLKELLIQARKKSGLEFSRLKKRIKKDLNLNVVERKKGNNVEYTLLEPKEQRKKGLATGKKAKPKLIKIEPVKTIKLIEELPKKKISLRELDRIEKQLKKDVLRAKKKGFFVDKKAQIQIQQNTNKYTKRIKTQYSIFKSDVQNYVDRYRTYTRNKERLQKENKLNNKNIEVLDQKRTQLNKQKTELETKSKQLNKISLKYGVILALLKAQELDKTLINSLNNQLQTIKELDNKKDVDKLPTPTKPNLRTTSVLRPKKVVSQVKTPTIPKKALKSTPKPTPKKKIKVKPSTKLKSKVKTNPMGSITYKTSKGTLKTIKTGLPFNKAKQLAFKTIDNTTLASVTIKKYGKTKAKDISPVSNAKFRIKKSNDPKVQKLVEKRSKRIDTKGEKKGLQASKYLAKQLKKAKSKKKSKK